MPNLNKTIYLLTSHKRFYGQSRKPWISINTDNLHKHLADSSYQVIELEYHQAVARAETIRDSIVLYSFSQMKNTRSYLRDLIQILSLQGNLLLPSYELLLCHENKGYQELFKKYLGIGNLGGYYLSSREEADQYNIKYPIVLKAVGGSNATGVHLVQNKTELISKLEDMESKLSLFNQLDILRRKLFRSKRSFPGWEKYASQPDLLQYHNHISPRTRFVLQEFIPGLDCDYRVIVLGERYFVSRRLTRPGDWRASGTKLFTYDEKPDAAILDYARSLYAKVGLPVLAMDLGKSPDSIHLFEFQASHFGITPIHKGPGYFSHRDGLWVFHKEPGDFERYLADAVLGFLDSKVFGDSARG